MKRELGELLDPNGPKAAVLKVLVGNEVDKALHDNDMMLSASIVAIIGAIGSDRSILNVLNIIPSLASPPDAVKFASHISPYLKKVYNEEAQYLRTRFIDIIITDQYDEIRKISKDPQYRAVRQQDLGAQYLPAQPEDHLQREQQQYERKMFLDFIHHETIGKYTTGVGHNKYKNHS